MPSSKYLPSSARSEAEASVNRDLEGRRPPDVSAGARKSAADFLKHEQEDAYHRAVAAVELLKSKNVELYNIEKQRALVESTLAGGAPEQAAVEQIKLNKMEAQYALNQKQLALDQKRTEAINKYNEELELSFPLLAKLPVSVGSLNAPGTLAGLVGFNRRPAALPTNEVPEIENTAAAELIMLPNGMLGTREDAERIKAASENLRSELTRYSIPLQREDNNAHFDDLREKMRAAGLDVLGVNAAELSAQRALTREWDQWAMSAGSAGDKVRALFKDLQLEGANMMGGIFEGVHAAIEGLEKNLAQFIITGRRRDAIKIGVQFEEKVLTSMLHAGVGKAAGGQGSRWAAAPVPEPQENTWARRHGEGKNGHAHESDVRSKC